MKKIFICLFIVFSLLFSTTIHANWFFTALRMLGSASMKTLDVTSKVTSIAGAVDAMRARRIDSDFKANSLKYENGKILLGNDFFPTAIQDQETANQLRNEAWENADAGRHLSAKRVYEQSLSFDANNSNTWHGYGWTLSELKKYDAANNAFTTAIYLNNYSDNFHHESESWRYLGWNYQRQGYLEEARLSYRESLAVNPKNRKARIGLKSIPSEIADVAGSKIYRITGSGVRFRSSPSKKGFRIGVFPYEAEVNLLGYKGPQVKIGKATGRWAQVVYQGKTGYVFGAYLEKLGSEKGHYQQQDYSSRNNAGSLREVESFSKGNEDSRHFHGVRMHNHTYPSNGVKHRHNNGVVGSLTREGSDVISASNKYIVQAGAFSEYQNAKKYANDLQRSGYNLSVNKRIASGRHLYYVEFIGFKNISEANSAKKIIASINPDKKFLAKKIQ